MGKSINDNKDAGYSQRIQKFDSGERTVSGYITTNMRDVQGDLISVDVARDAMRKYMQNPIVLAMHEGERVGCIIDYDVHPIGIFAIIKIDPEAKWAGGDVWEGIESGVLTGFSIGGDKFFYSQDTEGDPAKLMINEVSVVTSPANKQAIFWKRMEKMDGKNQEARGELLKKVVSKLDMGQMWGIKEAASVASDILYLRSCEAWELAPDELPSADDLEQYAALTRAAYAMAEFISSEAKERGDNGDADPRFAAAELSAMPVAKAGAKLSAATAADLAQVQSALTAANNATSGLVVAISTLEKLTGNNSKDDVQDSADDDMNDIQIEKIAKAAADILMPEIKKMAGMAAVKKADNATPPVDIAKIASDAAAKAVDEFKNSPEYLASQETIQRIAKSAAPGNVHAGTSGASPDAERVGGGAGGESALDKFLGLVKAHGTK